MKARTLLEEVKTTNQDLTRHLNQYNNDRVDAYMVEYRTSMGTAYIQAYTTDEDRARALAREYMPVGSEVVRVLPIVKERGRYISDLRAEQRKKADNDINQAIQRESRAAKKKPTDIVQVDGVIDSIEGHCSRLGISLENVMDLILVKYIRPDKAIMREYNAMMRARHKQARIEDVQRVIEEGANTVGAISRKTGIHHCTVSYILRTCNITL